MARSAREAAGLALGLVLTTACVGPPRLEDPSRSGVWGYLELVPHEGVEAAAPLAGAARSPYTDRRLTGATLVDYTRPGFAVVYLEEATPVPVSLLRIDITAGLAGARLVPEIAATAVGGTLRVENRTERPHVVSSPGAGVLRRLRPGDSFEVVAERAGVLALFLPGEPQAGARVFAAPGPFAPVDEDGRYELLGVAPGSRRLHVWHPRLPPRARPLVLSPGRVERVDLEVGVGLDGKERAGAD